MAEDRIQIARGSVELGVLSRADAAELLKAGFLVASDSFRTDDHQPWQPLEQLGVIARQGTIARVREATTSVGTGAARMAVKLVSVTTRGRTALGEAASRLLEDYLPRIRASVAEAAAQGSEAIDARLHDEVFLRKVFGAAYDTLPKPVRRFVGEEAFIEFCCKHRSKLLSREKD